MSIKPAIIDTCVFIHITTLDLVPYVFKIFKPIFYPIEVKEELKVGRRKGYIAVRTKYFSKCTITNKLQKKYLKSLNKYNDGEIEVVIQAGEKRAVVLSDDKHSHNLVKLANNRGLKVYGILDILKALKEKKLIRKIMPFVERLHNEHRYKIKKEVLEKLAKEVKEPIPNILRYIALKVLTNYF